MNTTIKPNYFKENTVKVYNPDGTLLCEANEYTLMDLQIQIAKNKLEGFTYEWEENKGTIDSKGQLSNWFYGMFDLTQRLFRDLHLARKGEFVGHDEEYKKMLIS